jgi:tetratricopeptide (TPR) repeat protein
MAGRPPMKNLSYRIRVSHINVCLLLLSIMLCGTESRTQEPDTIGKAIGSYKSGDYEKALKVIDRMLGAGVEAGASRSRMLLYRGLANSRLNRYNLAVADFDRALLDADRNLQQQSLLFMHRGAVLALQGKHQKAVNSFDRSLERRIQAGNLIAYARAHRAVSLSRLLKLKQATIDCRAAIALMPKNAGFRATMIEISRKSGDLATALIESRKLMELEPGKVSYLLLRGVVLIDTGFYQQATAVFTKALALSPDDIDLLLFRGYAFRLIGDLKSSLTDMNKAVKLAPGNSDCYRRRGAVNFAAGHVSKATEDFAQAIKLSPESTAGLSDRASLYEMIRDYDRSMLDRNRAIKLQSSDAALYLNRGFLQMRRGKFDLALLDYARAIKLAPQYADAYLLRGLAFQLRGLVDPALVDYNIAVKLESRSATVYVFRGLTRALEGSHRGAFEDYAQAIKLAGRSRHNDSFDERASRRIIPAYMRTLGFKLPWLKLANTDQLMTQVVRLPLADSVTLLKGLLHGSQVNTKQALAAFSSVLKNSPKAVMAYLLRGHIHETQGSFNEAQVDYRQAIANGPEIAAGARCLSWMLATTDRIEIRKPKIALELALQAVAITRNAWTLEALAASQAACGQYQTAAATQKQALKLLERGDKKSADIFSERIRLYESGKPYRQKNKELPKK